jgi:hydrogenase nickel incorporation protein HypB
MCATCGCGDEHGVVIARPGEGNGHHHHHDHEHHHAQVELELERSVLHQNDLLAQRNRGFFEGRDILSINLVSSPGSGKTSLLEASLKELEGKIYVIEGDQQTANDALRIEAAGAEAIQINTGKGCHLDAHMVLHAIRDLKPEMGSTLIIENVGNLVCPSMFDLGESKRVVVISVTEGEDKPLKYPYMFESAQLCIINKIDLLPYVDFDVDRVKTYARQINPQLEFIELSATKGEGMNAWLNWIENNKHK